MQKIHEFDAIIQRVDGQERPEETGAPKVRFRNAETTEYRKATHDDINAITDMLCVLYEMNKDEVLEENEQLFADANQAFFLAFDGNQPVGVSHGSLRREYVNGTNDDLKGYLEAIYVLPEYRNRRIAAELVKVTERWMGMNGCREMASDCLLENTDSYRFHLKIGFEETERCIFFLKTIEPQDYSVSYELREVHGADEKSAICEYVLRALPNWFGVEASIVDYIEQVRELPFIAAYDNDKAVGFIATKPHTPFASEICVMGILNEYHRRGIGRSLVTACEKKCKENKQEFLTVKTLAESRESKSYEKTRLFYLSMGFKPIEVFPTLWHENNPCLVMIKSIWVT